jgi:hypothetical protein
MCLSCLARLAVEQPSLHAEMIEELRGRRDGAGDGDALPAGATPLETLTDHLTPGAILGNRYQIRSRLGRGGMGEVWLAFDLKLRVDVALKAVHTALLASEKAIQVLRQEVRSAREVVSPNVCRVYQLEELGDRAVLESRWFPALQQACAPARGVAAGPRGRGMSSSERLARCPDCGTAAIRTGCCSADREPDRPTAEPEP